MNRSLIASLAALSIAATPALAATTPVVKPINTALMQHKKSKALHTKLTKSSVDTSKNKKSN
jgi:hypothetical protein